MQNQEPSCADHALVLVPLFPQVVQVAHSTLPAKTDDLLFFLKIFSLFLQLRTL